MCISRLKKIVWIRLTQILHSIRLKKSADQIKNEFRITIQFWFCLASNITFQTLSFTIHMFDKWLFMAPFQSNAISVRNQIEGKWFPSASNRRTQIIHNLWRYKKNCVQNDRRQFSLDCIIYDTCGIFW